MSGPCESRPVNKIELKESEEDLTNFLNEHDDWEIVEIEDLVTSEGESRGFRVWVRKEVCMCYAKPQRKKKAS